MPRRVTLPGASELFRGSTDDLGGSSRPAPPEPSPSEPATAARGAARATGRVRHEEKITVYVSRDELMELERARLSIRGEYGIAVDRGRIVRAAVAGALADFAAQGADSDVIRRLTES